MVSKGSVLKNFWNHSDPWVRYGLHRLMPTSHNYAVPPTS